MDVTLYITIYASQAGFGITFYLCNTLQFISVAVVFVVGYLSQVYPTSVGWILVGLTALAALLSGKSSCRRDGGTGLTCTHAHTHYVQCLLDLS